MASEHGLTAQQVAEIVRASRKAQGLPERVVDPVALSSIVVVLDAAKKEQGAA
jgi:hypothetical protein